MSDPQCLVFFAAAVAVFMACNDAPTEPAADDGAREVILDKDKTKKAKGLHFARVKADGTLKDGTALTATRLSQGDYLITFASPIDGSAGAANPASFPGFDGSTAQVVTHIGIGTFLGDDESVRVGLISSSLGTDVDSSLTLILVCP